MLDQFTGLDLKSGDVILLRDREDNQLELARVDLYHDRTGFDVHFFGEEMSCRLVTMLKTHAFVCKVRFHPEVPNLSCEY